MVPTVPRRSASSPRPARRSARIKHVWLIILENKSYDETFTGLNQNSYLWQTLPQQGALLTNYYGTGHFSMDNYISLVSGQAPSYATQDDCSTTANMTNNNSGIITTGTVGTAPTPTAPPTARAPTPTAPNPTGAGNGNYGQLLVHGGVDAALGNNGCVYPTDVADAVQPVQRGRRLLEGLRPGPRRRPARRRRRRYVTGTTPGVTDTVPGRDDGACGYPGASTADPVTNPTNLVAPTGDVTSFTGAQPANANSNGDPADQYVAKHFPIGVVHVADRRVRRHPERRHLPGPAGAERADDAGVRRPGAPTNGTTDTNCDANHVANLDDPTYGLAHDLSLPANEVPAFNWITPNNCSDAHDATCQGNNLSGAFNAERHAELHPGGPAGRTTPRRRRRPTTPAGCTRRTCSCATTSR